MARVRTPFAAIVVALTASALAEGALLPFLVLWAHRDAGLHGSAAGLVFVALAGGELAGGLVGGVLGDRLGARRVLFIANAGMGTEPSPWPATLSRQSQSRSAPGSSNRRSTRRRSR